MEYKHERFIMNPLCEFRDKEAEADFMEYEKTASISIDRFLILFMGVIFAAFIISDYYHFGQNRIFIGSVVLRLSALLITFVAFFLAGKFSNFIHTLIMITLTELAVFIIYLVNLSLQQNSDPPLQFMSMMLFILSVFLIPNRWKNCVITGIAMVSTYIIFCYIFLKPSYSPSLFQRGTYLIVCLLFCSIFLFGRERSDRRHFAAKQYMEYVSITDRLTGIYNRGRFEYILGLWIKNMRHDPFCLVLFDIDDFKKVNDTHGHSVGDQVLIGMTEVVSASIRDDDVFARWGGEEFVILFGETPIERAKELAERVRRTVENKAYENLGPVTISLGVVQYKRDETITDLVNRADEKMYEAKQAGKNRVMAELLPETPAETPQQA